MRKSIRTYIDSIAHDNEQYIKESGISVAEYIISNAENGCGWTEFFDSEEYEHNENFEPSCEQISELKNWISENYK